MLKANDIKGVTLSRLRILSDNFIKLLEEKIAAAALQGKSWIEEEIPWTIDFQYIFQYFEDNGFKAYKIHHKFKPLSISISW